MATPTVPVVEGAATPQQPAQPIQKDKKEIQYDLLLLTDATGSMGGYLRALNSALPEIARVTALTDAFTHIGVLAYRDYCGGELIEWSGWCNPRGEEGEQVAGGDAKIKAGGAATTTEKETTTKSALLDFSARLQADYGGDWPEATKTGLAKAYDVMREGAITVIVLYTDAPPHMPCTGGSNRMKEKEALKAGKWGPWGHRFADWVTASATLAGADPRPPFAAATDGGAKQAVGKIVDAVSGKKSSKTSKAAKDEEQEAGKKGTGSDTVEQLPRPKKLAQVFSIVQSHLTDTVAPYIYLSEVTHGACLHLSNATDSGTISRLTLGLLLSWMGIESDAGKGNNALTGVSWKHYSSTDKLSKLASEEDDDAGHYFMRKDNKMETARVDGNTTTVALRSLDLLRSTVLSDRKRRRATPLQDFSKRYKADWSGAGGDGFEGGKTVPGPYRRLVVRSLLDIIRADVASVTVNPVFGSLWRAVCNDRGNDDRDVVVQAFGDAVNALADGEKRARLKVWLEESYDYAAEIAEAVAAVPAAEKFPCVYLDPTLDWSMVPASGSDDDDVAKIDEESKKNITEFTREELLEIGRSCDPRILRRLGRVLTGLSFCDTQAALPAHIADAASPDKKNPLPLLPLALVKKEHGRRLFKVLLHLVLPGTMLAARPAALLAALTMRMGIAPLLDAAEAELRAQRPFWNTLDIPETWNSSCLGLLLEADAAYRRRHGLGDAEKDDSILLEADRKLFAALVDYRLLELNLNTTLTARVAWRPDKSRAPIGPTVSCKVCGHVRSVTMMAADSVCGHCVSPDEDRKAYAETPRGYDARLSYGVDRPADQAIWVQCAMKKCRAQYIVYNDDMLNVRPKCHYCREQGQPADKAEKKGAAAPTKTTTAPVLECTRCLSRVIWPKEYRPADLAEDKYLCPACEAGTIKTIVDAETTASQLIKEDEGNGPAWLLRNDDDAISEPLAGRSLFQVVSKCPDLKLFASKVEVLPALGSGDTPTLTLNGSPIHAESVPGMLATLSRWIAARRSERGSCSLCCESMSKSSGRRGGPMALRPSACGRKGCAQPVCVSCMRNWYGRNGRGRILNAAALCCPFCRRQPAPRIVASSAPAGLTHLGGLADAVRDTAWIYGWCWDCGLAKRFAERRCADAGNAGGGDVERWRCEECEVAAAEAAGKQPPLRVVPCPGCGVPTSKAGGCDHIECPKCGAHWCFFCGKQADDVYAHMAAEHGGYWGGRDYDTEEDYEDEDY